MKKVLFLFLFITISMLLKGQSNVNIIESNNRFAFDVYNKLKKTDNNLVLSPLSITSAIAMTYVGAENNTFNEISSTFYFTKDKIEISKDYLNLFGDEKKSEDSIKIYNANSLWVQNSLALNQDYIDINKNYFRSTLFTTDFMNDPEKSRKSINSWVQKNTNDRIKDLIKPSLIDNSTRLVLVNALYFKGAWNESFNKNNNTEEQFQVGKKDYITTTFMNKIMNVYYYSDNCVQIVDIPYTDEQYSLMVILPKTFEKFKNIEQILNYAFYENYINNKEMKRIDISLPKFDIESEFDLNSTLRDLGMKESFTSAADFTGITKQERLYISQVVHKANITVDEEGTEAAAATAVMMRKAAILSPTENFIADKPFIFILRNNENNLIYFVGKILNPNEIK